jgi:hypothetical protein
MSGLGAGVAFETLLEACHARCLGKGFLTATLNGISMVHLIHQLRAWNQNSDIPIAPSELVHLCGHRQASVQSDKIFAVTGLFGLKDRSSSYNGLDINYQTPYTEVYMDFTIWCIQQERNLDVLAQQRNEGSIGHSSLGSPRRPQTGVIATP